MNPREQMSRTSKPIMGIFLVVFRFMTISLRLTLQLITLVKKQTNWRRGGTIWFQGVNWINIEEGVGSVQ